MAALEVVVAEIGPLDAVVEDVPAADEDAVADGFAGPTFAATADEAAVLGGEVSALGACCGHRRDREVALQPAVAVAGGAMFGLAG